MLSVRSLRPGVGVKRNVVSQQSRTYINHRTTRSAELEHQSWKDKGDAYTLSATTAKFIFLNRPKQLNALNLDIIRHIYPRLKKYEESKQINSIVLTGYGDKAFCAGGDIMNLYKNGSRYMADKNDEESYMRVTKFFEEEYKLNYLTSTLNTPLITVMNGITMGGGAGLALHTHYSFATEKTLFAMPETSIGFFPDVGSSHFLPRCENEVGMYLALTGDRIRGADLTQLGLARYFSFTADENQFFNRLSDANETIYHVRNTVEMLNAQHSDLPRLSLTPHLDCIERCFSKGSVEEIMEALRNETKDVEFAQKTLRTLESVAPLSLKVTYRLMRMGKTLDLEDCFTNEYRVALNMVSNPDFYTGVKSVLIDKIRNSRPNWVHDSVAAVPESLVDKYFDLPNGEKDISMFNVPVWRGSGWKAIQNFPFEHRVTEEPLVNAHPYPMFDLIPQQKYPTEHVQSAVWAHSRDVFHTNYWNYLFRTGVSRFNITIDDLEREIDEADEYIKNMEEKSIVDLKEGLQNIEDMITFDPEELAYANPEDPTAAGFADFTPKLYNQVQQLARLTDARALLMAPDCTTHNKDELLQYINQTIATLAPSSPSSPNGPAFNSLNEKLADLRLKYPQAAKFIAQASMDLPDVPNLIGRSMPQGMGNPMPRSVTAMVLESTESPDALKAFGEVKDELRKYYTELAPLFMLPVKSAGALVSSDMGDDVAHILSLFDAKDLKEIDPESGIAYGDIGDMWIAKLEAMDINHHIDLLSSFGANVTQAKLLNRPDAQVVYDRIIHEKRVLEGLPSSYDPDTPQKMLEEATANRDAYVKAHGTFEDKRVELAIIEEANRVNNLDEEVDYHRDVLKAEQAIKLLNTVKTPAQQAEVNEEELINAPRFEIDPEGEDLPAYLKFTQDEAFVKKDLDIPDFVSKEAFASSSPDAAKDFFFKKLPALKQLDIISSRLENDVFSLRNHQPNVERLHEDVVLKPRFIPYEDQDRIARQFLFYLGLNYEAIQTIYPGFEYHLLDGIGNGLTPNYDGAQNLLGPHEDAFKINFTDYSRPMIPPRLLKTVRAKTQAHKDDYYINHGLVHVYPQNIRPRAYQKPIPKAEQEQQNQ